ncbi:uncharacterized protein EI90DRAFT_3016512 [Cantharellus anzutake]|uniref:uncharacterized protein n=1 Tax=Cantharellus anzutake TaxID=1750568 RepID=UPI00190568F2|nr:uncharacterized protein EI90DRAFT_3016512 [Cantharellus anzutake]KAF8331061.1 hypothetical protein EI90DRAFT_3016512 [Cantharellus anzutake]
MLVPRSLHLHFIACALASGGLLAFLGVLDFLMFSSFLEHRKFDIAHIKSTTQILSFVPQLIIVLLLALLSYGIQTIAVHLTIQRCQLVLALHDNVEACYLYKQRSHGVASWPRGVNDTILFGTMDQNLEGIVFEDHMGLKLSAKCGIIPQSGDHFDFRYYRGRIQDYPDGGRILFSLGPKFTPIPGSTLHYMNTYVNVINVMNKSMGTFVLGGEKPTPASPPPFSFLLNEEDTGVPMQGSDFVVALVTTKNYVLGNDRRGSPIQLTKEVQVYTSLPITPSTKHNISLESVNITFNIWPIGCAMYTQNLTAHVSGSDQKLLGISDIHGYNSEPRHLDYPFERKSDPANLVEEYFGFMLFLTYFDEYVLEDHQFGSLGRRWGGLWGMPPFGQAMLSALTSTPLNSKFPSLNLSSLELQLTSYYALTLGVLLMNWHVDSLYNPNGSWTPIYYNTSGTHHFIQAITHIAYIPLTIVTVFSACLMLVSFFIIQDALIVRTVVDADWQCQQVVHDGSLFDMISLLAGSHSNTSSMSCCCPQHNDYLDYGHIVSAITEYSEGHLVLQAQSTILPLGAHQINGLHNGMWTQEGLGGGSDAKLPRATNAMGLWVIGTAGVFALISFHGCLVALSMVHVLDHLYFDVKHLGIMNQILLTSEESFTVIVSALVTLSISSLACDASLQKRMPLGALHYMLAAWRQGLGFCIFSLAKFSTILSQLQLTWVFVFFVGIMVTHVATPAIVTTEVFNASISTQFTVDRIPGLWSDISFSSKFVDDIADVLAAAAYVLDYTSFGLRNIGSPLGSNETILNASGPYGGIFIDPFATKYTTSCSIVPQPTYPYTGYSVLENQTGVLSLARIAQSPHVLLDRGVPLTGSYALTFPMQIWTYIQNDSISSSELGHYINKTKKLETVNVTLYVWPIACALHVLNGTAVVTSDNKLKSFIPALAEIPKPPPGYIWPKEPTHIIEKIWGGLIYLLVNSESKISAHNSWIQASICHGTAAATGEISGLGDQLSLFTATWVGMLDQHWRMKYQTQAPISGISWQPLQATATVYGSTQVLSARFTIHSVPLYFGCLSSLLVGIASAIALQRTFNRRKVIIKEAGILHCIWMLQWSSLTHSFQQYQFSPELNVQCNGLTLDVVQENDAILEPLPDLSDTPVERMQRQYNGQ